VNEGRLYELKKIQDKFGVLMSFAGPFSQGIIEEFGDATKAYIDFEEGNKSINYNVFSIYIEQTQNIRKYIESKLDKPDIYSEINKSGIVTISKRNNYFAICSGNLVENSDIDNLQRKLDNIKDLDKTQLKELYKTQRKKILASDADGAGLGLIEMARKASTKIEFSFQKHNDNFSFFCLEILV
jgi:ribosome-associated translation inhibitor RaiA